MLYDPILGSITGNIIIASGKRLLLGVSSWFTRRLQRKSPFKTVTLCLRHRPHTRHQWYERAFASGEDVLYLTIMSQHNLKQIGSLLENAKSSNTHLRVLTWNPNLPSEVIEAFRKHINENDHAPQRTLNQVKEAAHDWDKLALEYPNIEVRKYSSSPTMQGFIVGRNWAQIELLPFACQPEARPAILLSAPANPETFQVFRESFEDLWDSARDSTAPKVLAAAQGV